MVAAVAVAVAVMIEDGLDQDGAVVYGVMAGDDQQW